MPDTKIVATGPLAQVAVDILQESGELVIAPDFSEDSLIPLLGDAAALVVRGEGSASARVIAAAPRLAVIGRSGVGYNNIDIAAASSRRIPVVFTPGAGARAVAEGAMALVLALCKNLSYWDEQLKAGNWHSRFESSPGDLEGATLGIVGFGRIGQDLARLAAPFDMTIIAHDPYVPEEKAEELGVRLVPLHKLFSTSDFISLHAAATPENRGMIDAGLLRQVRKGAILVNMARGDLVQNLDVLHQCLMEGRLAGVGLDVFAPEPPDVSHPIFKLPNCLTTPHALGTSRRATAKIFTSMARDVVAVLEGRRPRFVVNPDTLS